MGEHKKIPLGELEGLLITGAGGNLHLTGWSQEEIRINDVDSAQQIEEKKGILTIEGIDDLILRVPHNLPVEIKSVSGDANLRGIASNITIGDVAGDLSLRDVGSTTLKTLQGDLLASRIQGVLRGEKVFGDAIVEDVQGQLELKDVSGDLQIEQVAGGIDVRAAGDARLELHPVIWQAYRVEVKGDISLTIPMESDADLKISSEVGDINLFPGKLDIRSSDNHLEYQLGEGGTPIQLSAVGKVFIIDDEFSVFTGLKLNFEDLGNLTADFSTSAADQIRDSLDHLESDLRESLSGLSASLEDIGLSEEYLKDLGEQIEETSRKAAEKAEVAAIKAQAKTEKRIAKARMKVLHAREKTKQFDVTKFLEKKANKDAVSKQERLLILNMLQEKKISPDEADRLLKALEGK